MSKSIPDPNGGQYEPINPLYNSGYEDGRNASKARIQDLERELKELRDKLKSNKSKEESIEHKYIRTEFGFVLWPTAIDMSHVHVADVVQRHEKLDVLSAGFVRLIDGKPNCFGESFTLNKRCDQDDDELLAKQLGF